MKKIVLSVMVLALAVSGLQAREEKQDTCGIKAGAATVVSDTPGIDGAKNLIAFQFGDVSLVLTKDSPKSQRRQAVKMCYELYKLGKVDYTEYVEFAKMLDIKPKAQKNEIAKRRSFINFSALF